MTRCRCKGRRLARLCPWALVIGAPLTLICPTTYAQEDPALVLPPPPGQQAPAAAPGQVVLPRFQVVPPQPVGASAPAAVLPAATGPATVLQQPAAPGAPTPAPPAQAVIDPEFLKNMKAYEAQKKAEADATAKAAEEKKCCEGYVVGSDTKVTAAFENGWLWLRTPNDDFNMHIGFWLQMDKVYWTQSPLLHTPQGARAGPAQGVASGAALGGIGDLSDGFYFRRIRPFLEGTLYEVFEYRLNLALENNQFQTAGLDEVWVGWNKIPALGSVRVGHFKNAWGLEGDMTSSSRTMTFMERSSMTEAIYLNQNFGTGLWFGNSYLDDHVTYQTTLVLPDNGASSGAFFGDGQWGTNSRLTALPLYEDEGRHLLHLGGSFGWRNGTSNNATSSIRTLTLQARPEMRDDVPAGSTVAGLSVPNANSNRMVSTGPLALNNYYTLGTELLYIHGPFSLQVEHAWGFLDGVAGVAPTGFTFHPAVTPDQNYTFQGGYVQVCYTLTGENRAYDKKFGSLARDYFKNGPFTNAWFVRDGNGNLDWGWGAWELAARWTYVNLNDGAGVNRVQGGAMQGVGLGLNWYLSRDLKVQFEWNFDHRYDLPVNSVAGNTSGFGIRTQLSF